MTKKIMMWAYAKINLQLTIKNRLENGYHEIDSIFQAIDLHDTLSIKPLFEGYELTGSIVCAKENNIITKAKEALENLVAEELPCRIHLIKGIPIEAGLGGGSSDAACALIGLNELFNLKVPKESLLKIGRGVGADVPYFINGDPTAHVEGIGERISQIKIDLNKYYVIARPHFRLSTAKMYSLYDALKRDFTTLAKEICPPVEKIINHFSSYSQQVCMSGSGPTVFAGFDDYKKANQAIEDYGINNFNGDFFICKPVDKTYKIL